MMYIEGEPATVAGLTPLALYGYGHFTSMRVEAGRVRGLALHLERLVRDCRTLFDTELDVQRVRRLVRRAAADPSPVIVRVTVFAPELAVGYPRAQVAPRLLVSTRPAGGDDGAEPLRLRSARFQREPPEVKHTGLFGAVHQRRLAQQDGFDDAVFVAGSALVSSALVSEGPTWNIGFIEGDTLVWPDARRLPGVTMRLVTTIAGQLGIPCETRPVHLGDLPRMQAAVLTSAGLGLRSACAIDDCRFEPDVEMVTRLRDGYEDLVGELV